MITFSFDTWNHSVNWDLPPSLPEQIVGAAAAGYEFVGLDVPSLLAHRDAGLGPDAIRALLDEREIGCYELVPLPLSDDRAAVDEAVDACRPFVRTLGAKSVLAVARGALSRALVDNARRAAEALAEDGATVSVEFLPSIELDSIDAVRALVEAADTPALRVMIDSWHFFAGPSTWESLAQLPLGELGFVQFCDAVPPVSDDVVHEYRQRRVVPGEGTLDLARFADAVLKLAPDVTVSIEVLSADWRARPPAELAAACLTASRPYWESDGTSP